MPRRSRLKCCWCQRKYRITNKRGRFVEEYYYCSTRCSEKYWRDFELKMLFQGEWRGCVPLVPPGMSARGSKRIRL